MAPVPTSSAESSSGSGSTSTIDIIIIVASLSAFVLIAIIAGCYFIRRRSRRRAATRRRNLQVQPFVQDTERWSHFIKDQERTDYGNLPLLQSSRVASQPTSRNTELYSVRGSKYEYSREEDLELESSSLPESLPSVMQEADGRRATQQQASHESSASPESRQRPQLQITTQLHDPPVYAQGPPHDTLLLPQRTRDSDSESISLYSQPSFVARPSREGRASPIPPLPTLPSYLKSNELEENSYLQRSGTQAIGKLLVARAQRNTGGQLFHQASLIERSNSIRPMTAEELAASPPIVSPQASPFYKPLEALMEDGPSQVSSPDWDPSPRSTGPLTFAFRSHMSITSSMYSSQESTPSRYPSISASSFHVPGGNATPAYVQTQPLNLGSKSRMSDAPSVGAGHDAFDADGDRLHMEPRSASSVYQSDVEESDDTHFERAHLRESLVMKTPNERDPDRASSKRGKLGFM